ncbi:hypothetical protein FJY93_01080 [Candidatus Kaiserbacteria bacterium]|nr:hypothetical protein [Candidatus Kaiserbacteria bacterium]
MPYIPQSDRTKFDDAITTLKPEKAGELNYIISRLCADYIARMGKKYATLNEVMGVLTCAASEFYRRLIAPYEDEKIKSSGDIAGY